VGNHAGFFDFISTEVNFVLQLYLDLLVISYFISCFFISYNVKCMVLVSRKLISILTASESGNWDYYAVLPTWLSCHWVYWLLDCRVLNDQLVSMLCHSSWQQRAIERNSDTRDLRIFILAGVLQNSTAWYRDNFIFYLCIQLYREIFHKDIVKFNGISIYVMCTFL
jgi:hypothetical protein